MGVVSEILRKEETFRELNSRLQGITSEGFDKETYELSKEGYYDLRTFRKIMDELEDTRTLLYDVFDYYGEYDVVDAFEQWIDEIERQVDVFCYKHYPWMVCEPLSAEPLREYQDRLRDHGINCGFIQEEEYRVSFVRALDSFTNCLHTFGLELAKIREESKELEKETYGICTIVEYPENDNLVDICRIFAEYVNENFHEYYSSDQGEQEGYIYRDKVQFKVGGAVGHKAEIDLRTNEFHYYDHHYLRGGALKSAIENVLGLECEGWSDTFTCKGVDLEKAKKLAKLLAFVPSIDIYIDESIDQYAESCIEGCIDDCRESGDAYDVCLAECKGSESEEDFEECIYDCETEQCYNYCNESCREESYDAIYERAYEGFVSVLEGYIDSYYELKDYLGGV